MSQTSDEELSPEAVEYLIHHVFLPPKLPQEDDFDAHNEACMLRVVSRALHAYRDANSHESVGDVEPVLQMISLMQEVHESGGVGINEAELKRAFRRLCSEDGTIPLHIRAQNAGLLISKVDQFIRFEAFELSPLNSSVNSTGGRLLRSFPGVVRSLGIEAFSDPNLRDSIASSLAKMSIQEAGDTKPKVRKAGEMHPETRDTTHPRLITELFMAFVGSMNDLTDDVPRLFKKTREEVLWHTSFNPWRRSPGWLLLRIALQLAFSRSTFRLTSQTDPYKVFMIFLLGEITHTSTKYSLSSDLRHAINAKVVRRLFKLRLVGPVDSRVWNAIEKNHKILQSQWSQVIAENEPGFEPSRLQQLDFHGDVDHNISALDEYIQSTATWKNEKMAASFLPEPGLISFPEDELPVLQDSLPEGYVDCNLTALETWVALSLQQWLDTNLGESDTCKKLASLLNAYHRIASPLVRGNPESASNMLLTILEIWIACDKSALASCQILRDYDPGIPIDLFQTFILPCRSQMTRLLKAEKYLFDRRARARFHNWHIFHAVGTPDCFAVRYFNLSSDHQALFESIQREATVARSAKSAEFRDKRNQYNHLVRESDKRSHDEYEVVTDTRNNFREFRHSRSCYKCYLSYQASDMKIDIHEWPLPKDTLQSRSVVFELRVPPWFRYWRDATFFLLNDVFRFDIGQTCQPIWDGPLSRDIALAPRFASCDDTQRISLLSEIKPHSVSHRKTRQIKTTTDDNEICVNNGLEYRYHDKKSNRFTSEFQITKHVAEMTTYQMPAESSSLQQFLVRPSTKPNGPSPNTVIASLSGCPIHIPLEEYKAMASIPLGVRIQWQNILVQLSAPFVDFNKLETVLIVLQTIHQAGPSDGDDLRESHKIFDDDSRFTNTFVRALREAFQRVKENWERFRTLSVFTSLALRLQTLNSSEIVGEECLALLADVRTIAFGWIQLLREKMSSLSDSRAKSEFMSRALHIAFICVDTFNVDERYLERVLDDGASILLQCFVMIHEGIDIAPGDSAPLYSMLRQRWQSFSYRAYSALADCVLKSPTKTIDNAIKASWSTYEPGAKWSVVSEQLDYWLVSETSPMNDGATLTVHLNLLTGELLADGRPLARLPQEYERHESYRKIFDRSHLEVMPTVVAGMHFSGKLPHFGHNIHFGLAPFDRSSGHDLRVQAEKGGSVFNLIPTRLLDGYFPTTLVNDFVHWFDTSTRCIYFRSADNPWTSDPNDWRLVKDNGSSWRLMREDAFLISVDSQTAKVLSHTLAALEDPLQMQMTYQPSTLTVSIDIPRVQLGFYMRSGSSYVMSKQFPEMSVDFDQSLGTLVGFRDKLVLIQRDTRRRQVILLEGPTSLKRQQDHVVVRVNKRTAVKAHVYRVDQLLWRLVGNGSLQSQLWLCYCHAVTSFCLPDPFLWMTGTEKALSILGSAGVLSYECLSHENLDLLTRISRLTPERKYYPANETVMQTVEWSSVLSASAQHNGFYKSVRSILDQVNKAKIFYPESATVQALGGRNNFLIRRDDIRNSTIRVSGFGAEDHTSEHDVVYSARDQGQGSKPSHEAFAMSTLVHHGYTLVPPQDLRPLETLFPTSTTVLGSEHPFEVERFLYDSELLHSPDLPFKNWCPLHKILSSPRSRPNKFQFAMWISALAFSGEIDLSILHSLALCFVSAQTAGIQPPRADSFDLSNGSSANEDSLRTLVREALRPFESSPEAVQVRGQSSSMVNEQRKLFQSKQDRIVDSIINDLTSQWPCEEPHAPADTSNVRLSDYIEKESLMQSVRRTFKSWFNNRALYDYLRRLGNVNPSRPAIPVPLPASADLVLNWSTSERARWISVNDNLAHPAPVMPIPVNHDTDRETPDVGALINQLEKQAVTEYQKQYVDNMRRSLQSLQGREKEYQSTTDMETLEHLIHCKKMVLDIYDCIESGMSPRPDGAQALALHVKQWPRVSPTLLLQQLSRQRWSQLSIPWQRCIVRYGVAITELQRAERLVAAARVREDLVRELQNTGHTNWDPFDYPESLLLEVESGILIRDVQEAIAKEMREPRDGANVVMQLNMGEGKSSVIVPIVAAALANGSRLVRVIVARPQAKQMFQMLVSKFGTLLNRRVYRMPFSRALRLGEAEADAIGDMCRKCMESGGILLVQPEHILSLQLMGLQCLITDSPATARSLLATQTFFDMHSRDIIDESDENFSVKFELVYAMGDQRPIDHSPDRWSCIQQILGIVSDKASEVAKTHPLSMEVFSEDSERFPRIRILQHDAQELLVQRIARHICENGLTGFPAATQPIAVRQAMYRYIVEPELSEEEIRHVEGGGLGSFWSRGTKDTLLLLRGLFAGGIIAFAFRQKRWRVNYGLHLDRERPTKLAVPYRAKDSPSARSEFSHPDVVIVLTCLCYYYQGLLQSDLLLAFSHLRNSDQADVEYQAWVKDARALPAALSCLSGVNLEDGVQFANVIFPSLRLSKSAVDYFLAHVVYPKEMKEFPQKLSASGWDLGKIKTNASTGFSGTNDSQNTLPLTVKQLDLPEQEHTSALVLSYLLRPENSVSIMAIQGGVGCSALLSGVVAMHPPTRVILDVGAQIIDLSNLEVAKDWLQKDGDCERTRAVVFFNENDELSVVDRKGHVEALQTSPFADQLDQCLVFLDEAHTRGTDLRLPVNYRAAVTVGPNVTKDRLVQACMRMRKLGRGQSVVFCVPEEIKNKLGVDVSTTIGVSDVLCWAVSETWNDMRHSMPLWAAQGDRFLKQSRLWADASIDTGIQMSKDQAEAFLEDDAMTLEQRYRPVSSSDPSVYDGAILERCQLFGGQTWNHAKMQEEQERELSPEIEREREVQLPPAAKPAIHRLHPDVERFVSTGELIQKNGAFMPAFDTLAKTNAADYLDISQFPKGILATADFCNTIKPADGSFISDSYQRTPQWILTSTSANGTVENLIVISPFEAQELFPKIRQSRVATLHLYAPRTNQNFRALDGLDLYTLPAWKDGQTLPLRLKVLLNLFAGQLYLGSFAEYQAVCRVLGVASERARDDYVVAVDGFLSDPKARADCSFQESPVKCLTVYMTKIRRDCEAIDKTHMGAVLGARLLMPSDFDEA